MYKHLKEKKNLNYYNDLHFFAFIILLISNSQSNQRIIIYFIHIANFLNFNLRYLESESNRLKCSNQKQIGHVRIAPKY